MNHCQAGHEPHKRITVPSIQGDFLIYNYKQYMGFNGYCTGQDDVSRTIDLYGKWDEDVYQCILSILETAKPGGVFIDIGCHIGWFSKLVSEKGFIVKSFDGESENLILAEVNAPNAVYTNLWFDEKIELLGSVYECELM